MKIFGLTVWTTADEALEQRLLGAMSPGRWHVGNEIAREIGLKTLDEMYAGGRAFASLAEQKRVEVRHRPLTFRLVGVASQISVKKHDGDEFASDMVTT